MSVRFRSWLAGAAGPGDIGVAPLAAKADTLYGITFSNQLITINQSTGAGTLVGPLDSSMSAFDLTSINGKLYTFDQTADVVRQLDPATGHTLATISVGAISWRMEKAASC